MITEGTALEVRGGGERTAILVLYLAVFFGALPALLWALGGRFDDVLALAPVHDTRVRAIGVLAATMGLVLMTWAMLSLSVLGSGLPVSHLPPVTLVERGPHAWMRHPIYVGFTALFGGAGLALGSIGRGLVASALLAAGSAIYALGFEEPRLRARFGSSYESYAAHVPAFPFAARLARAALIAWRPLRPHVERFANRVVLGRVGPTVIVTYGAFAGIGTAVSLGTCHLLLGGSIPAGTEAAYLALIALWMVLLARVIAILYRPRLLLASPVEALRSVGFVSWGGYLGMFTFPFAFGWATGHDPWWLLDRTFLSALACSGIGRIGCLTYGCCYGRKAATGVAWTHPDAKPNREHGAAGAARRIPTQLLSAASVLLLAPIVAFVLFRSAPGGATLVGSLLYATARFGVECLRDEPRFAGMTRGQLGSAFGFALAAAILLGRPHATTPYTHVIVGSSSPVAWAAVLSVSFAVFLICGVHVRRVGRW